jgi:hypothetical protein
MPIDMSDLSLAQRSAFVRSIHEDETRVEVERNNVTVGLSA